MRGKALEEGKVEKEDSWDEDISGYIIWVGRDVEEGENWWRQLMRTVEGENSKNQQLVSLVQEQEDLWREEQ